MLVDDDAPFLTIEETAELLRVKPRTLDNLRWSGGGPPARRHGGRIVYHRREVLDWSEGRSTRRPATGNARKASHAPRSDGRLRCPGPRKPADEPPHPPVERKS